MINYPLFRNDVSRLRYSSNDGCFQKFTANGHFLTYQMLMEGKYAPEFSIDLKGEIQI
jgi:hypothetical protein